MEQAGGGQGRGAGLPGLQADHEEGQGLLPQLAKPLPSQANSYQKKHTTLLENLIDDAIA